MSATLVNYSQNSSDQSLQEMIAFCARVSNPANQNNNDTSENLLRYLMKHHHWSPFEMCSICLEIVTTRDIARQILRHRSFSFQEFSQRYAVVNDSFVTKEARLQDHKNRQNSISIQDTDLQNEWEEKQRQISEHSNEIYNWALEKGIAKEQARAVLPEGMTTSKLYMNGTIRSWIHYIQLRTGQDTQKEHREVAYACAQSISTVFPLIQEFISI
jgi:thymidylate synthase (FAD)